jgi:YVTN family beta-propeller protein
VDDLRIDFRGTKFSYKPLSGYMNKVILGLFVGLVFIGFVNTADAEEHLSPIALVADKDAHNLYVAEFTANQVAVFDVAAGKVTKVIPLPDSPSSLAISPDESYLYVTCASPAGKVYIIELCNKNIVGSISVGHTPSSVVVNPNGKTLYVCNQFNNNVSVIGLAAKKVITRIPVLREPVAAAITPNGKLLFVANFLPVGPADVDYTAAVVSAINTISNKTIANIQLPNGSSGLRGICVSPDGKHAYVTHILSRYQLPTTQLERGWMNTNALSIIDVTKQTLINTVLLDDIDLGAANPWGVTCSPNGKYICVTHAGTHEVSVIDRAALHEKLDKATKGQMASDYLSSPDDVPNNLAFLVGLRRRLKLTGVGPRGLTIIGTKAYIAEYFTDTLGMVNISPENQAEATSIALGPKKPLTTNRIGEILFNDASICFQHWQSCATCHPGSGRNDALNWDLLNDGMGNPKNTKSLLVSHKTPPAMITGIRDSTETAVRAGIKFILFAEQPEEIALSIDEYLKSLKPVPSPYLIDGKLSQAAERGREIFEKAGCASCHPAPLFTDLKKYKVGTGKDIEKNRDFDTPTLVEIWRTAPYLYDGRAVTIKEILTQHNIDDMHGKTSSLTEEQINDLTEFVLSQ